MTTIKGKLMNADTVYSNGLTLSKEALEQIAKDMCDKELPLLLDFDHTRPVGRVLEYEVDASGLCVTGLIYPGEFRDIISKLVNDGDQLYHLCPAFKIVNGGSLELQEVSMCVYPANQSEEPIEVVPEDYITELVKSIDDLATEIDHYECGLPLYDIYELQFRNLVLDWMKKYDVVQKESKDAPQID